MGPNVLGQGNIVCAFLKRLSTGVGCAENKNDYCKKNQNVPLT